MIPQWMVDGRTIRVLSRGIIGLATATGLLVLGCLGRLYWVTSAAHRSELNSIQLRKDIADARTALEATKHVPKTRLNDPKQAMFSFQSQVQATSARYGSTLVEFTATAEKLPYLSKYTNATPPAGWAQIPARLTLSGRLSEIMDTLQSFNKFDVPHEIDGFELIRSNVDRGQSNVTAQIQLRVLMREEKS